MAVYREGYVMIASLPSKFSTIVVGDIGKQEANGGLYWVIIFGKD